ncbi:MAG: glycosyltransferase [Isosphaeraceae bacterium]|nr:glycosyltransferase [Isosphaeraceae bacterium]
MGMVSKIKGGLTSVVVLCGGSLARTQLCIAALLRNTRRPWELVAIADGGGEVAAYLAGVRTSAPVHVEIVRPAAGRLALAAGLEAACGDCLAVLNEGTIVTDGWLDQLTALLESNPKLGAVGPMSNGVAPPQRVESVACQDPVALRRFAAEWRKKHRGQWSATERLADCCVVTRRKALASSGSEGIATLAALAARLRSAGLSLAVARDLFVYRLDDEADTGLEGARGTWVPGDASRLVPKGTRPDSPRLPGRPSEAALERRPGVTLTMIVRNEEANLAGCLESATGLFDEIIVADTGSADRTPEIARQFGANVVDFPWVDDFAAARNAALDHVTTRYAFWLDADDRIDDENRKRLVELFGRLDDSDAAYVMKQLSVGGKRLEHTTAADHVRLFPVRADVRWSYRVHEQLVPSLRGAGVAVRWTDIGIGHVGYADPRLRTKKRDRNLRILLAELQERPNDPFVLFNIGWVALDRREWRTALGYLRASLAASAPRDSIVGKLYVLIARAHQGVGEHEAALAACEAGRAEDPENAELLFRQALIFRERGELARAEACWREVLKMPRPSKFSSVVTGIYGHFTRRNLAALAENRGDREAAIRLWDEVLSECPGDPEAIRARGRLSERAGDAAPGDIASVSAPA